MITQLVLVNVAVFLIQQLLPAGLWYRGLHSVPNGLALVPQQVVTKGMVWELVTYMFLHGGGFHLLFNMLGLVIFGSDLERWWGSRAFLKYYLVTGAGAGVIHLLAAYVTGGANTIQPVVGASGAIFGVLLAFGMAFPTRQVLLMLVIPVSARTMVVLYGLMELAAIPAGGNVARFAHLGGMLVGYLYLKHESFGWKLRRSLRQTGTRVRRAWDRPASPEDEARRQERIDQILEKISREGTGALTEEEKRFLHDSAERARRRQRAQNDR
jgi:membrane associated rhomboid family serine protease